VTTLPKSEDAGVKELGFAADAAAPKIEEEVVRGDPVEGDAQ